MNTPGDAWRDQPVESRVAAFRGEFCCTRFRPEVARADIGPKEAASHYDPEQTIRG
jgi:hypothetical protein